MPLIKAIKKLGLNNKTAMKVLADIGFPVDPKDFPKAWKRLSKTGPYPADHPEY